MYPPKASCLHSAKIRKKFCCDTRMYVTVREPIYKPSLLQNFQYKLTPTISGSIKYEYPFRKHGWRSLFFFFPPSTPYVFASVFLIPYSAHVPWLFMVPQLRVCAGKLVRSGQDGSRGVPLAPSASCALPLQRWTPAVLLHHSIARERLRPQGWGNSLGTGSCACRSLFHDILPVFLSRTFVSSPKQIIRPWRHLITCI